MANSVTFSNGHVYTDDSDPTTGLDGGGWRDRFVPCLADVVLEAANAVSVIGAAGDDAIAAVDAAGAIQVALAEDQVALAAIQAGLATTNGAAQVALAADQVDLATTQAELAEGSANAAALAANASKWVSGTTYTEGFCVWSPTDFKTYRRKTTGGGTTDPSADNETDWASQSGSGGIKNVVTATTATTLTNTPTLLQITPTSYGVAVTLPDATTCDVGDPLYIIDNRSGFGVFIKNASGTIIDIAGGKTSTPISLNDNSTADGIWSVGTSGLVLINETVAANAVSAIFTNLDQVFSNYELRLENIKAQTTDNISLYLYGSDNNGSTWKSSGYICSNFTFDGAIQWEENALSSAISLNNTEIRPNAVGSGLYGSVEFFDIGIGRTPHVSYKTQYTKTYYKQSFGSGYMTASVGNKINAIKVAWNGDNMSGTLRLYGVRK